MKVLVAIVSCHKNKQQRDWQRATWIPYLQFDYKFFLGKPDRMETAIVQEENVVVLDCKDDYKSLPEKIFAVIKWALDNAYNELIKIDDDVYVRPERLLPPSTDYTGHAYGHKHYCSGAAYWLSERAMLAILRKWYRRTNAEDSCVGESLKYAGISLTEDHRYRIGWKSLKKDEGENEFPHPDNDTITFHMYFPDKMLEMHNNYGKRMWVTIKDHCSYKDI